MTTDKNDANTYDWLLLHAVVSVTLGSMHDAPGIGRDKQLIVYKSEKHVKHPDSSWATVQCSVSAIVMHKWNIAVMTSSIPQPLTAAQPLEQHSNDKVASEIAHEFPAHMYTFTMFRVAHAISVLEAAMPMLLHLLEVQLYLSGQVS